MYRGLDDFTFYSEIFFITIATPVPSKPPTNVIIFTTKLVHAYVNIKVSFVRVKAIENQCRELHRVQQSQDAVHCHARAASPPE